MNAKLKTLGVIVCAAACIACVVYACGKFSHAREINIKRAETSSANAALKEKLHAQDAQTAEAGKRIQSAKVEAKKTRDEMEKRFKASREREEAWKKLLNENPAWQNKQLAAYRVTINRTYGPFFYKMGLDSGQRKKLAEALAQRLMDTNDLNAILADAKVKPEDAGAEWQQVKKETGAAFTAAVTDVLGEEGMREFARFESNRSLWEYVSNFAAQAAQSGIPLTLRQADKLVDVMASAPDRQQLATELGVPNTEAGWAYIDEQVQIFLSKEQAEMLRTATFANVIGPNRFDLIYGRAQREAWDDIREKQNASGGNGD